MIADGVVARCNGPAITTHRGGEIIIYTADGPKIRDANGQVVAEARAADDASAIVETCNLIERIRNESAGLHDGETPVNGADLLNRFAGFLIFIAEGGSHARR